jgi:hypothetical protein
MIAWNVAAAPPSDSRCAMCVASATPAITISATLRKRGARRTECSNTPAGPGQPSVRAS